MPLFQWFYDARQAGVLESGPWEKCDRKLGIMRCEMRQKTRDYAIDYAMYCTIIYQ